MITDLLRIAMSSYYLPSESKIGVGYQAHGLAEAFIDLGHQVTMFSPCIRPTHARYAHEHLPIYGSLRTFRWAKTIAQLDLSGFDVFHAHGDDYYRRRSVKPVHLRTLHGSCFAEAIHIRGLKGRARMALLGVSEIVASFVADKTICVSENTRAWYPWVKEVIPNGLDTSRFHPGTDHEPEPTILFVGTFGGRKRGRLLMDIFEREVRPQIPTAQLWMVCVDAPPAPGVSVLGRLSDEELADRYKRAWVFCLPSSYEGFGVPYIEAMASGTPIVATLNPGAKEVLRDGAFGVLANDAGIGSALVNLLTDPIECARFSKLGVGRSQVYSWPKVAQAYVDEYRVLIARKAGR